MRTVITGDGSPTFHHPGFCEHYHSKSGAREEAFLKYAAPCKIAELARIGRVRILDFCFGLGYNTAAAIDAAREANPLCEIEVVGLENDDAMLQELLGLDSSFASYPLIQEMLRHKDPTLPGYSYSSGNLTIQLLLGDAKETCKTLPARHFDAVFFDPFSPPKNPDLWTVEVFREMRRVILETGVLSTYSCARAVREAMRAAGFLVLDGPIIGRRSPSTLAYPLSPGPLPTAAPIPERKL